MKRTIIVALVACSLIGSAQAQNSYFGKNKVQYKKFEWHYIQSTHFDVYFSQDGYDVAVFAAVAAESAYTSIKKLFRYEITNRISFVIHNSHNEFQQTNVVGEYMEEGVGGVTELFKNRVVVPFEGSYRQFRHVLHHELVHAVINDMFYGGSIQALLSSRTPLILPLWFNEGLAEYAALRWETNSDMFIRDATIHNYLPPIEYLGGYFAYRGGQSVFYYIASKYGEQKIGEILNRVRSTRNLEQGFKSTIGLTLKELSERWQKEQKVLYWPDIAKREEPTDYARRLTNHTKDGNFYNTSPAISPQGDRIAFISDRNDYFDVYVMSAIDGEITDKVVSGQRTKDFEELHLLTPGLTWSPDGKQIAIAVKSGERDAIMIIDVKSGKTERLTFDLDGIFSVDWSPEGSKLAFVGLKPSQSDIYVYDFKTKVLTNLTDDIFSDSDPSFAHDGKTVYFSSDRRSYLDQTMLPDDFSILEFDYGSLNIYAVNIEDKVIRKITGTEFSDESSPIATADGKRILFISDRNGINNIYENDLETGTDRPITNSLTGVYQLSLSRDGSKMAFSSMSEAGFDIFLMRSPMERRLSVVTLEATEFMKRKLNLPVAEKPRLVFDAKAPSDTVTVKENIVILADTALVGTGYQPSSRVDLRNYVFTEEAMRDTSIARPKIPAFAAFDARDAEGNFVTKKYKLNFSPDLIYGTAAYSTFYGVEGTTLMMFSDMLGDHQIVFQTNLLLDLKNSDYGLSYFYLPHRIDYGFQGFHSARFIYLSNARGFSNLYRFRQWALGGVMQYPIDRFNRFDLSALWLNLSRENLDDPSVTPERRSFILPLFSYVRDNSLWQGGWFGPNNGSRFNFTLYGSAKFNDRSLDLQTFTFDYRNYTPLMRQLVFVFRATGGASFGVDQQSFFVGGTEGWINRTFDGTEFPIFSVEDYAFLTPILPLRGYNYNAQNGTRYGVMNLELRFPLIRYFILGALPLGFQNILGAAFLDVGSAWSNSKSWQAFEITPSGSRQTKDLLIGTGLGARLVLFGLPLRLDVAWRFNWSGFSEPRYYLSLGPEI